MNLALSIRKSDAELQVEREVEAHTLRAFCERGLDVGDGTITRLAITGEEYDELSGHSYDYAQAARLAGEVAFRRYRRSRRSTLYWGNVPVIEPVPGRGYGFYMRLLISARKKA